MTTLLELSDHRAKMLDELFQSDDGEISQEMEAALTASEGSIEDKAESICRYRQGLLCEAEGLDAEIRRLTALRDTRKKKADWLKDYLKRCMEACGMDRINRLTVKLRIQKNSVPTVRLKEGAQVPEAYRKVRFELDTALVHHDMKAGNPLPPEIIVTTGTHLRIS